MRDRLFNHFNENMAPRKLFVVDIDWEFLWNMYLDGFPQELNPIFRERRELDCSACRSFFKRIANVVAIDEDNGEYVTLFAGETQEEKEIFKQLDEAVKSAKIKDIFISDTKRVGLESNPEMMEDGNVHTWYHFYADVPERCVGNSSQKAEYRDNRIVLENSTEQISEEAVGTVLELIASNSLYRGDQWEDVLKIFKRYLKEYEENELDENVFYWIKSIELGSVIVRIKNHSIGVLLKDITLEVPLDEAVTKYESIVAPPIIKDQSQSSPKECWKMHRKRSMN